MDSLGSVQCIHMYAQFAKSIFIFIEDDSLSRLQGRNPEFVPETLIREMKRLTSFRSFWWSELSESNVGRSLLLS